MNEVKVKKVDFKKLATEYYRNTRCWNPKCTNEISYYCFYNSGENFHFLCDQHHGECCKELGFEFFVAKALVKKNGKSKK